MSKEFALNDVQEAYDQMHNGCMNCGGGHLTAHHGLPKSMGGDGRKTNINPLCRGRETPNCHARADRLIIDYGFTMAQIAEEGIAPLEASIFPRMKTVWERPKRRHGHQSRRRR
jgi:hypothetical protein